MSLTLAPTSDLAEPLGGKKRRYAAVYSRFFPGHYRRTARWSSTPHSLLPPSGMEIDVGDDSLWIDHCPAIDANAPDSWDEPVWAVPANRAGKDFYIYACSVEPELILSNNASMPYGTRFTPENTRKIGGFHCLCLDVGVIPQHPLSGFVAGDILPASVWDLRHRPLASPEGMVYAEETGKWYQIYLTNEEGSSTFNATPASTDSTVAIANYRPGSQVWFLELLAKKRMALLSDRDFQIVSRHSNQETAVPPDDYYPFVCGGHADTNDRRMISGIGLEDCCGYAWQWLDDDISFFQETWMHFPGHGSSQGIPYRAIAGGASNWTTMCGSRCRYLGYTSLDGSGNVGARGVSEPLVSF